MLLRFTDALISHKGNEEAIRAIRSLQQGGSILDTH